jgi:hypothetical protein
VEPLAAFAVFVHLYRESVIFAAKACHIASSCNKSITTV